MTAGLATGPIFLLAFERSGTNLLRRFLRRHPAIDGPSPIHLLGWLGPPRLPVDRVLEAEAFSQLVDDAITTASLPFEPWTIPLDREAIMAAIPAGSRDLLTLFGWLHEAHAAAAGKPIWFCKDRQLIDHAEWLAARWPEARFIYLHRDPRDVFTSYRKAPGGFKHPLPFVAEWAGAQRRTLEFLRRPALAGRVFRTSYEALLQDERTEVRGLCTSLGLEFAEDLIQTGGTQGIAADNSYWKNVERPVMRGNAGGFRTALTRRQIGAIEAGAWDVLQELGYTAEVATGPERPAPLVRWVGKVQDALARRWSRRFTSQTDGERAVVRRRSAFRKALARRPRID